MKIAVCGLLVIALALVAFADTNVSGKWSGTFTPESGDGGSAYLVLKQTGAEITGTAGPDESQQWPITSGKMQNNKLTADVQSPDGDTYKVSLVLEGDHLKGDVEVHHGADKMMAKLDVTRVK